LLSRSGEVKLCDFGLAAWASSEPADDHIRGKLSYLSPEQATGGVTDARSDVFSLGVVLYELIAGHHPIVAGTNVTVLHHLVEEKGYPLLRDAAPWIPEAVTKIIDRAINFEPENRFPSAEALGSELSKVLYTRFPDFTPQRLASLVIQIQSANEEWVGNDPSSQLRAKLASFASSRRGTSSMVYLPLKNHPSNPRKPLRLALVATLVLAIAAFSVVWLFARDRTKSNHPPETVIDNHDITRSKSSIKDEQKPPSTDEPDSKLAAGIKRGEVQPIPAEQPDAAPKERPSSVSDGARADTRMAGKSKKKAFGALDANASPWAEVSIDGHSPLTTPIIGHKLKVGQHRAVFTNPELKITVKREFTIKTNETTRIVVKME
jgi:serine/threonine-protein kinase